MVAMPPESAAHSIGVWPLHSLMCGLFCAQREHLTIQLQLVFIAIGETVSDLDIKQMSQPI